MTSFIELLAQYILDLLPWRVVSAYEWGVRSTFGHRPKKPLSTGLHIFIPGVHKFWDVAKTPQVVPLGKQSMISADGVCLVFSANVVIQVEDPISHIFDVHDFDDAMRDLAMSHLGERVHALTFKTEAGGTLDLDAKLLRSLRTTLETQLADWGTKVRKVGFVNFVPTEHQVRLFQDDHRQPEKTI